MENNYNFGMQGPAVGWLVWVPVYICYGLVLLLGLFLLSSVANAFFSDLLGPWLTSKVKGGMRAFIWEWVNEESAAARAMKGMNP